MHATIQWLVYASRYAGIGGVEVYEMEDRLIEGLALCADVHRRDYLCGLIKEGGMPECCAINRAHAFVRWWLA